MQMKMLKGIMITNAFLRTNKFVEHFQWLERAAERSGIVLSLFTNVSLLSVFDGRKMDAFLCDIDFILFWDKDISAGRVLAAICAEKGIPIFNSIESIEVSDDKSATQRILWEYNCHADRKESIPLIPTMIAPFTYSNIGYDTIDFVEDVIAFLGLPVVIKECRGSFGMQVYLAKTKEEVIKYTKELAGKSFLYQAFVSGSCGRDVRLQVVGEQVVAAMYRHSVKGDFRANLTIGGEMMPYSPSARECQIAVQAAKCLGLSFAGVDLLFASEDEEEATLLCEVNSNAHFKNIFTCTGVNVAECMMEEIRRQCEKLDMRRKSAGSK